MEKIRELMLPTVLVLLLMTLAAVAGLGWLTWDTRQRVAAVAADQGASDLSSEPDWAARIESAANGAGEEARRATKSADDAKKAAVAACEKAGGYGFECGA